MSKRPGSVIACIGFWVYALYGADYYVAPPPTGSPVNSGTTPQAPLSSIQAAADRMKSGDQCFVDQGIYFENVRILVDDVKFRTRGTVLVSAADPVTGWTQESGNIWKARASGPLRTDEMQVFIKGKWYPQARFPNYDEWVLNDCANRLRPNRCTDREGFVSNLFATTFNTGTIMAPSVMPGWMDNLREDPNNGWPTDSNLCRIGFFAQGKELTGPEQNPYFVLYGKPQDYWKGCILWSQGWWWSASGYITGSRDGVNSYTGIATTFLDVATPRMRWPGSFVVIGHRDLIDKPGEWAVDNGTLYLWIPPGVDPESGDILFRQRLHTFDLEARSGIELTGFHSLGGCVQMDTASNCTLDSCHFYCLNHGWLNYYGDTIPGFERAGRYGILFNGNNNTFKNGSVVYAAQSAFIFYGSNNTVTNSYVSDIDYINTYSASLLMQSDPRNSQITYSTFERAGRSHLGGYKSCTVKYNKFLDGMLLSGDGGVAYSVMGGLADATGTEVAYNWFKGCYGEPSAYLYSDWGCAIGMKVHHNVFFETPRKGKFLPLASCGMHFHNNTFLATSSDDVPFTISDSLYADSSIDKLEWANNINAAYDKTPWLFTDTINGDYTLQAGSPAIDAGRVIPGITDGYSGNAPDLGAYEYGASPWKPGHTWGKPLMEEALWAALKEGSSILNSPVRPEGAGILVQRALRGWVVSAPQDRVADVRVITPAGRMCLSRRLHPGTAMEVRSSDFGKGVYLLQVECRGAALTKRIVAK